MEVDEQKVIELGKIWMKKSINKTHNFEHAQNTLNHALKIYPQFKDLDSNLVEIACWWHDCYKSRTKTETFESIFLEGAKSSKMFEKEVGSLMSLQRNKVVSQAIKRHNNFLWIICNRKGMSSLDIVLYEADQLEQFNDKRMEVGEKEIMNPLIRIFLFFLTPFLKNVLRTKAISTYTKNLIKSY
jgi:HD superfamily phosphohydrolase YqeK